MKMHRSSGFTLLEVLIAVVLVGFAFLSTASLHIRSLRDTQQSSQIVVAAQLAEDLSARLRVSSPTELSALIASSGATTPACFSTAGCKPSEMAADEIYKWKNSIDSRLKGGGGTVCRDAEMKKALSLTNGNCTGVASDPIVVKVWWPLRGDSATTQFQQFSLPYVPKP